MISLLLPIVELYWSYEQPSPPRALALECPTAMRKAIEASLRGSLLNSKLTVNFRLDVYRYMFKDKWDCNRNDFPEDLFPTFYSIGMWYTTR